MLDDHKRTEPIKAWLTERELFDLMRLASQEDRKPGEMVRVIIRRYLYGNIAAPEVEVHGANSPEDGRSAHADNNGLLAHGRRA